MQLNQFTTADVDILQQATHNSFLLSADES